MRIKFCKACNNASMDDKTNAERINGIILWRCPGCKSELFEERYPFSPRPTKSSVIGG